MRSSNFIFRLILSSTILSNCQITSAQNSSYADSAIRSLVNEADTAQIIALMDLSMEHLYSKPDISIALLTESEKICIAIGDSHRWSGSITLHAFAFNDSLADSSLAYYERAIPVLLREKHHFQLQALANAADILARKGNYKKAIYYQHKAVDYAMENSSTFQQAAIISNLGDFYDRLKQFDKARIYHLKAIAIATEAQDTFMFGLSNLRLGITTEQDGEGDLDSTLYFYHLALAAFTYEEAKPQIALTLGSIANTYIVMNEPDSAEHYLSQAIALKDLVNRQFDYAMHMNSLGKIYFIKREYTAAIDQLKIGLEWAKKVSETNFEIDALEMLHECYTALGDYKNANLYLKQANQLNDSIFSQETAKEISNLEVQYETAIKEQAIAALSAKKIKSDLQLAEQQNMIFGISGAAVILLLLALFGGVFLKQKQKTEIAQRENEYNENLISNTVNSQEEERQRIAKELHDGIAQTLVGVKMQLQSSEILDGDNRTKTKKDFEQAIASLTSACDEVRTISHQMMPLALRELGLISALKDMLEKSLKFSFIEYKFEHQNLADGQLAQRTEIALYRIAQELVNNIIKHSQAKAVEITLAKTKMQLTMTITDDGIGLNPNKKDGIGMSNINSRASAVNGKVNFESLENSGTSVYVQIPLSRIGKS